MQSDAAVLLERFRDMFAVSLVVALLLFGHEMNSVLNTALSIKWLLLRLGTKHSVCASACVFVLICVHIHNSLLKTH